MEGEDERKREGCNLVMTYCTMTSMNILQQVKCGIAYTVYLVLNATLKDCDFPNE